MEWDQGARWTGEAWELRQRSPQTVRAAVPESARYLAFLLPARDPDGVRMIDLGEAEPIDRMIELLRAGVSEPPQARNMFAVPRPLPPSPQNRRGSNCGPPCSTR